MSEASSTMQASNTEAAVRLQAILNGTLTDEEAATVLKQRAEAWAQNTQNTQMSKDIYVRGVEVFRDASEKVELRRHNHVGLRVTILLQDVLAEIGRLIRENNKRLADGANEFVPMEVDTEKQAQDERQEGMVEDDPKVHSLPSPNLHHEQVGSNYSEREHEANKPTKPNENSSDGPEPVVSKQKRTREEKKPMEPTRFSERKKAKVEQEGNAQETRPSTTATQSLTAAKKTTKSSQKFSSPGAPQNGSGKKEATARKRRQRNRQTGRYMATQSSQIPTHEPVTSEYSNPRKSLPKYSLVVKLPVRVSPDYFVKLEETQKKYSDENIHTVGKGKGKGKAKFKGAEIPDSEDVKMRDTQALYSFLPPNNNGFMTNLAEPLGSHSSVTPAVMSGNTDAQVSTTTRDGRDDDNDTNNSGWETSSTTSTSPQTPTSFPPFPPLQSRELHSFYRGLQIALENIVSDHTDDPSKTLLEVIQELEENRPTIGELREDWERRAVLKGGAYVYEALRVACEGSEVEQMNSLCQELADHASAQYNSSKGGMKDRA